MRSAAAEFEAAMEAAGLKVSPAGVKADGKFHRCDVEGEGGEGEGSYQLDLEGIPAGSFQNIAMALASGDGTPGRSENTPRPKLRPSKRKSGCRRPHATLTLRNNRKRRRSERRL